MRYYSINMGQYTTIVLKVDLAPHQLLEVLTSHRVVRGHGDVYHNLKNYESFHEISNPDDRVKKVALPIERVC